MFDVNDDAKGEYRRVEVLVGRGRRRRWSAEEKARIVEESLVPGARVSEVARRWQVCSQQGFGWRRAACQGTTTVAMRTTGAAAPDFVPITTDAPQLTAVLRAVRASASRT
jgi:transposase